jgi:hypothetical protein
MVKRFNRNVAMYVAYCVEVREDDGRRQLMTVRLLVLSWLFLLGPFITQAVRTIGLAGSNLVETTGYILAYAIAFSVMYLWWKH